MRTLILDMPSLEGKTITVEVKNKSGQWDLGGYYVHELCSKLGCLRTSCKCKFVVKKHLYELA